METNKGAFLSVSSLECVRPELEHVHLIDGNGACATGGGWGVLSWPACVTSHPRPVHATASVCLRLC